MIQFAYSDILYWIWALVPLAFFLFWRKKKKQILREKFVEKVLLRHIAPDIHYQNEDVSVVFLICVIFFSIVALARPQWGFEWREIKREGLDILVAVDTSKSMLTDDVKPNRLERSKLAVKDLVKKLNGDRIGLMAFSSSAFLVCPMTVDYSGFLLSLEDINTSTIPQGGTSLASAIKEGIRSYKNIPGKYKAMIVITDGEDLEGEVAPAAQEAKKEGIQIFSIGIGTSEGELIRLKDDKGNYEFLKDSQENFVKSRLNEQILQEIALITGGMYVRASGAQFGLEEIYDQRLSKMEKKEIKNKMEKRYFERFQIPLCIAFLFLCWETFLPRRKNENNN